MSTKTMNFRPQSIYDRVGRDEKFLIKIYNSLGYEVYAPLPDGFGFTAGSEYSAPFDVNSLSSGLQKAYAVAGFAQKIGMRMRKFYTNPEPTEISFDMEFTAEVDTLSDVMFPVILLYSMSLGGILDLAELSKKTQNLFNSLSSGLESLTRTIGLEPPNNQPDPSDPYTINLDENSGLGEKANGILKILGIISAPESVNVQFGNVMNWERCFITSVATSFSNVLDSNGYPMSAKCTVTITPEKYPVADDIDKIFGKKVTPRARR